MKSLDTNEAAVVLSWVSTLCLAWNWKHNALFSNGQGVPVKVALPGIGGGRLMNTVVNHFILVSTLLAQPRSGND